MISWVPFFYPIKGQSHPLFGLVLAPDSHNYPSNVTEL